MANECYIEFQCVQQKLWRTDERIVAADAANTVCARFTLCEKWTGLNVYARFERMGAAYDVTLTDGCAIVPHEALKQTGFYVSLFGEDSTGARLTSARVWVDVAATIDLDAVPPIPATPSLLQTFEAKVSAVLDEGGVMHDREQERISAENARVVAETAREAAESDRVTAETAREAAESTRETAEAARESAETTRQQNETARENAESGRVTAENARIAAEEARETAESARATAETARADSYAATQAAAEAAATSASNAQSIAQSVRDDADAGKFKGDKGDQGDPATLTASAPIQYEGGVLSLDGSGFAAASHTHKKTDITDFPTSMPASDVSAWAKAATKPTYTAAEVGAAAATHGHAAGDITSGTLPIARGGTGVTTEAAIGLKAYPVGAVYISYVSTSPASLFGGTWTAITGRFPYFNAGTGTGGSNTHTLTVSEMPSHSHSTNIRYHSSSGEDTENRATWGSASSSDSIYTSSTGGGGSHNNMPAYQTLYAWRRTA